MQVTVELFATFQAGRFTSRSMEVASESTVRDVASSLEISGKEVGLILINNRHSALDHLLAEGDTLTLFPLLEGG